MTLEDEIGDGPLTFILILKSCRVGAWNPGTSQTSSYIVLSRVKQSNHLMDICDSDSRVPSVPEKYKFNVRKS